MGGRYMVLVVEDDDEFARLQSRALRRDGYDVRHARTGAEAIELARRERPDLTLLDFELPDMDGFEVLDELKAGAALPPMPVLFLTGTGSSSHEVLGLDGGATDYIEKNGDIATVLARVRSALRHARTHRTSTRLGPLYVDPMNLQVTLDGVPKKIDRKPLLVLHALMEGHPHTVPKEDLLDRVWTTGYRGYEHALDQSIYKIRRALGDPRWIVSIPAVGYRFQIVTTPNPPDSRR